MGFAGAYVAQAADPSAIFYNAAGIGFLKGKQLYVGGAFAGRSTDFTGSGPVPAGGHARAVEQRPRRCCLRSTTRSRWGRQMVVGLGVSRPFGTRSEWQNPDEFTGRYICLECKIDSWSINPTIAYRLADRFSIGAGVDVRLSQLQPLAPPGRRPQPVPGAHGRRRAHARRQHRDRGRLQPRPAGDAHREPLDRALLPARGDDRPRRAGQLRADPHRQHRARPGGGDRAARPRSRPRSASPIPASIAAGVALRRGYWTVEARLPVDALVELRRGHDQLPRTRRPSTACCRRSGRAPGAGRSASST